MGFLRRIIVEIEHFLAKNGLLEGIIFSKNLISQQVSCTDRVIQLNALEQVLLFLKVRKKRLATSSNLNIQERAVLVFLGTPDIIALDCPKNSSIKSKISLKEAW